MTSFEEISERERRFLIQTYDRYAVAIERGKGVFLYDLDGKRYLDFVAGLGVNALGHAHPRIVKVTREQAARVIHLSNLYYNEYQGRPNLCAIPTEGAPFLRLRAGQALRLCSGQAPAPTRKAKAAARNVRHNRLPLPADTSHA